MKFGDILNIYLIYFGGIAFIFMVLSWILQISPNHFSRAWIGLTFLFGTIHLVLYGKDAFSSNREGDKDE